MQVVVQLGDPIKKKVVNPLIKHALKIKRALRRHKRMKLVEQIKMRLKQIEVKRAIINQYRSHIETIAKIQSIFRYLRKRKPGSRFKFNKRTMNKYRLIVGYVKAFYQGWKLRKIFASRFVKNAVSQYEEYLKFLAETEMDSSVSAYMKS